MLVQNWDNIFSGMMFDYAAINETIDFAHGYRYNCYFVDCSLHNASCRYHTCLLRMLHILYKHQCDPRRRHMLSGLRCGHTRNVLLLSEADVATGTNSTLFEPHHEPNTHSARASQVTFTGCIDELCVVASTEVTAGTWEPKRKFPRPIPSERLGSVGMWTMSIAWPPLSNTLIGAFNLSLRTRGKEAKLEAMALGLSFSFLRPFARCAAVISLDDRDAAGASMVWWIYQPRETKYFLEISLQGCWLSGRAHLSPGLLCASPTFHSRYDGPNAFLTRPRQGIHRTEIDVTITEIDITTTLLASVTPHLTTWSDTAPPSTSSLAAPTKSPSTTEPTSNTAPVQVGRVSNSSPTTTWSDGAISGTLSTTVSTTSSITTAASTLSIAASTSSSVTIASTSSNTANYVIVGGVVGGLVALVATILVIFRFRWRGRGNRATGDPDAEPKLGPFVQTDVQQRDAELPSGSKHPRLQITASSMPARLPAHQPGVGHSSTSDGTNGGQSAPPYTDPSSNALSSEALEPARTHTRRVPQTQPILTDDQADFVNSLHANNVLAAAIMRVMESMMAGEERPAIEGCAAALGSLQSEHDDGHDTESTPPPSYDHAAGWK
ncbi:hypothetical protein BU15DRAFT_67043 [Melanogaster broomeanus]|nr:hypothetical protein BU15DRAFT_67043 [Melanogaster broomeanus]